MHTSTSFETILDSAYVFSGKVMLNIGCGMGTLRLFPYIR